MQMFHSVNSGFLSLILIVMTLMITVSNRLMFRRIELRLSLQNPSLPYEDSPDFYKDFAFRDLRKKALLNSEADRLALLKAASGTSNKEFYKAIRIEAHCQEIKRIGEKSDGGKFVCNPEKAKKDCTLISLGLENTIRYDVQIYNATGSQCKILGVDKNPQNEETHQKYEEMGGQLFQATIPNRLTIPEMLEKTGRVDVEFLKMDIEGGEFRGLEPLIKDYFVCQIFIEVHGKPSEHLTMMRMIAKYGFRMFSIEPNPQCPKCCEYSYINEMCMHQFGVIPLAITVPH